MHQQVPVPVPHGVKIPHPIPYPVPYQVPTVNHHYQQASSYDNVKGEGQSDEQSSYNDADGEKHQWLILAEILVIFMYKFC